LSAATRRLHEELGITANLTEIGVFHYCATVGNNLIENEIDHVLIGEMPKQMPKVDPLEIAEIAWVNVDDLKLQLQQSPERYRLSDGTSGQTRLCSAQDIRLSG
jgi:isopentenyldiphosphate isomerase